MIKVTKEQACLYLLRYQKLSSPGMLKDDNDILSFIKRIGCIQYDPLCKIAKNADLVLQSRVKNYKEIILNRLLYEKRALIDGWDKNMSIWPTEDWPLFKRSRDLHYARFKGREDEFKEIRKSILSEIKNRGSISSKEVKSNRKVSWSWAPTDLGRAALESMYHYGELVIHHKDGSRKYYGLSNDLLPKSILEKSDPNRSYSEYVNWYVYRRIKSIGLLSNRSGDGWLGTSFKKIERDIAIKSLLNRGKLLSLNIEGLKDEYYISHDTKSLLDDNFKCNGTSFIAPLDNIIWDRKLIFDLFNFEYKWEVYTPVKDRKYGYYVLPILQNGNFIGRIEPVYNRKNSVLEIKNIWYEKGIKYNMVSLRKAILRFQIFIGAEYIVIEDVKLKKELKM